MDNNENGNGLLEFSNETTTTNSDNGTNSNNVVDTPNQNVSNTTDSNGSKKGGAGKVIAIIIGIVVVVGLITWGVFAFSNKGLFGSKVFASKGQRFMQLATTDQKFLSVFEASKNTEQINTNVEIKVDELAKAFGGQNLGIGNFLIDTKEISKGEDYSLSMLLSVDEIKDAKIELQVAKTGDIIGINIPEIMNKFIAADLSDIDGLQNNLKKLGLLENEIYNSSDEDNEANEKKIEEFEELLKKYLNVFANNISDYVEKTSNVTVSVGGHSEDATEYVFELNSKNIVELGIILEKELLKNKDDIEKLSELGLIEDIDEFTTKLEENIKDNEEMLEADKLGTSTEEIMSIKLYEKGGKNIATVFDIANEVKIGLYVFEESKGNYDFVFQVKSISSDDMELLVDWTMQESGNIKNGSLGFTYNYGDEEIKATVCDVEIEELSKATDDLITIDKSNALLLNDATQEDIKDFAEEVSENVQKLVGNIATNIDDTVVNNDNTLPSIDDNDDDDDIILPNVDNNNDNNSSTSSNNTSNVTGKKIDVSKGFIKAGQELYNKVEPKMTRAQVIAAIGEPTKNKEYESIFGDDSEFLMYIADGMDATEVLRVCLTNGIVTTVEIPVASSNITKIYLSKELNTDIEDLSAILDNVKTDMTLEDVEKILGKNYYQSRKTAYDSYEYTWYDKKDNHAVVYIGGVLRNGTTKELVSGTSFSELW